MDDKQLSEELQKLMEGKLLSEKIQILTNAVSKVQYESINKGYNIDMERITLLMEAAVNTFKQYESL